MINYITYSFRRKEKEYYEYLYFFNHFTDYYSASGHRCYLYDLNRYHGWQKKGLCAAIGCTLGIIPHLFMSITLSSFLMQMRNTFFTVIQLIGACYLLYLGAGMIFAKNKIDFEQSPLAHSTSGIIWRGLLINLLNPKLTLFFFSFLPQYISHGSKNYIQQGFILGLVFMLLTLLIFICYGILAGTAWIPGYCPRHANILFHCCRYTLAELHRVVVSNNNSPG